MTFHSPPSSTRTSLIFQQPSSRLHDLKTEGSDPSEFEGDCLAMSMAVGTSPPPYREKCQLGQRHSRSHLFTLRNMPRRSHFLAVASFLVGSAVLSILYVSNNGAQSMLEMFPGKGRVYPAQVFGAPTGSFKDNLRADTKYITSWINAGWTNDVMTYMNLLYLAHLTQRTAILPPFAPVPEHIATSAGFISVSRIFDLPRLTASLGVPIIEWDDIKDLNSSVSDELGCWSIWAAVSPQNKPRRNSLESHLNLDIAYTPVPNDTFLLPRPQYAEAHTRAESLASLTYPNGRQRAHLPSSAPFKSKKSNHTNLPDEHLACFDFTYYVASLVPFEFGQDWSPVWNLVGTHLHWSDQISSITTDLIRKTFGTPRNEKIPPFISIHIRHTDFKVYCDKGTDCFAPLSVYANAVEEVKDNLRNKGIVVEKVLVTSDERDPKWWDNVKEMGWEFVDHTALQTEEKFGKWYPVFIDGVIQSFGAGFVGTDHSTMSLIAQRRVEDWNGGMGATRQVVWGKWAKGGK